MSFRLAPPTIKKWSLRNSERVAVFRVFALEKHDVFDSEGKQRHSVMTFVCPDWCNVIAVTENDEVILVWQYRYGTDELSLEIPGGVVDPGEQAIHAAERELGEETGYSVESIEPFISVLPNPAMQGNRCHTFLARGAKLTRATKFDENEELEVVLVPRKDLRAFLDEGHIPHVIVQNALERFLRVYPV